MPPSPPILITAFGPFGGRTVNASALALGHLRQADRALRVRTLPVDLMEAPRRLHTAIRCLRPRAIVLLGEAAQANYLRIESRAWNTLDFAIPDVAGRQPRGRAIDPHGPEFLETVVDVDDLRRGLEEQGHVAEVSSDPGRYLCNRIYHAALRRAEVPALFVHLPLESRLAPARAAAALAVIVGRLRHGA